MAVLTSVQSLIDDLAASDAEAQTAAVDVVTAVDALDTLVDALAAPNISQNEIDALVAAVVDVNDALTALNTVAGAVITSRDGYFPWGQNDDRRTGQAYDT